MNSFRMKGGGKPLKGASIRVKNGRTPFTNAGKLLKNRGKFLKKIPSLIRAGGKFFSTKHIFFSAIPFVRENTLFITFNCLQSIKYRDNHL